MALKILVVRVFKHILAYLERESEKLAEDQSISRLFYHKICVKTRKRAPRSFENMRIFWDQGYNLSHSLHTVEPLLVPSISMRRFFTKLAAQAD